MVIADTVDLQHLPQLRLDEAQTAEFFLRGHERGTDLLGARAGSAGLDGGADLVAEWRQRRNLCGGEPRILGGRADVSDLGGGLAGQRVTEIGGAHGVGGAGGQHGIESIIEQFKKMVCIVPLFF